MSLSSDGYIRPADHTSVQYGVNSQAVHFVGRTWTTAYSLTLHVACRSLGNSLHVECQTVSSSAARTRNECAVREGLPLAIRLGVGERFSGIRAVEFVPLGNAMGL